MDSHAISKTPLNVQLRYDDYVHIAFDHLDMEFT